MTPERLSHELRNETSPDLKRRRWIIGLSLLGVAAGKVVTLYQTGILKRLPDLPFKPFDSNRVNASNYGYSRLQSPDAVAMIVNTGITAWLAAAGGKERAEENPLLPIALTAKTLLDSVATVELGREEWQENKALCAYCQTATLASFAMFALSLPEAIRAGKRLMHGPQPTATAKSRLKDTAAASGRLGALMAAR